MFKKIYCILASLLVLSACSTDDLIQDNQDGANRTITFNVDVPSQAVITKSTSVPTNETGIENLQLVTFNGTQYLGTVAATAAGSGYTAVISKQATYVQFVANYDDVASLNTVDAAKTTATNNYSFFAEKSISSGVSNLGTIEMLRNWSKISLDATAVNTKLYDVHFMVYNRSQKATVAPGSGTINMPSSPEILTQAAFVSEDVNGAIHTFEQNTTGADKNAFVIIQARYGSSTAAYSYYKIDLAVTDATTGQIHNYPIIRNYWYKITVSAVEKAGVTWAKVISSDKVADNNITASTVLDKYPKISYDDETLEVTKTTYVFTKSGMSLNLSAKYTKGGVDTPTALKLIYGKGSSTYVINNGSTTSSSIKPDYDISNVVDGDISMTAAGAISANINDVVTGQDEKITYFYVKGGNLQRTIKLILRNPYEFTDMHFYSTEAAAQENGAYTEGTTNKVAGGPGVDVYLGFTIPETTDPSLFPMECKIASKTLYSVTDGVRVETTGNGTYYYIYTAKAAGRQVVHFKTNSTVTDETVTLANDYFANATAKYIQGASATTTVTGTSEFYYTQLYYTGDVTWATTSQNGTLTVSSGSYSESIPTLYDNDVVTFTYTYGGITYTTKKTFAEWKSNGNLVLLPPTMRGTIYYYSYRYYCPGPVSCTVGSMSVSNGSYVYTPSSSSVPSLNDSVTLTYKYTTGSGNNKQTYTFSKTVTIEDLINGSIILV